MANMLLTVLLVLCFAQTVWTATYIARTPSQVVDILNNCSIPVNYTMEKQFFSEVRSSEAGLCLNLSQSQQTTVNTTLVTLKVRRTNHSNIYMNTSLKFPCFNCSTLHSAVGDVSLGNTTTFSACLALSRFSRNVGGFGQSLTRLSDVISVSFFNLQQSAFITFTQNDSVYLQIPLFKIPDISPPHIFECRSLAPGSWQWNSSCVTNQTSTVVNGIEFIQCSCSVLGWYAVFLKTGSSPLRNKPRNRLSVTLDTECTRYLYNTTTKADFLNTTRYAIAMALNTSAFNVIDLTAECGSIIVNFTLISPNGTNEGLEGKIDELGQLVSSNEFTVNVDNHKIYPYWLRNYGGSIPGNVTYTSLYYHQKFATELPTTKPSIQPLEMDYSPFIMAVAIGFFAVFFCICSTCIWHSWYLHKKKYTEFNSDRNVPKPVEPVVEEEEEEEPISEFSMTYKTIQKPDQRAIPNYDWARTSYAPEPSIPAYVTPYADDAPRLILDEDDEESLDESHPPSEDISIDIDSGAGSELGSGSDSDEEGITQNREEDENAVDEQSEGSHVNVKTEEFEEAGEDEKRDQDEESRDEVNRDEANNNELEREEEREEGKEGINHGENTEETGREQDEENASEDTYEDNGEHKDRREEETQEATEEHPKVNEDHDRAKSARSTGTLSRAMTPAKGMPEPCM